MGPSVFPRFLMALAVGLTLAPSAQAGCRGRASGCLIADGLWLDPFGDGSIATSAPATDVAWRLGGSSSYQRRPLVVTVASPDPFGNEVDVLDQWWTSQFYLARHWDVWGVALVAPFSYGTGRGADAIMARASSSSVSGFGDPHLVARFSRHFGSTWVAVTQRLAFPLGNSDSFLSARGLTYAPKLTARWRLRSFSLTSELGLRLRPATEFGNLRFGSELYGAVNAGWEFSRGSHLFVEWWATPSLTTDESDDGIPRRVQRAPSEVMAAVSRQWGALDTLVGLGTSLPLSTEETATGQETFAGPPSPELRLHLQVEVGF